MLDVCGIPYKLEVVDSLKLQNKAEPYLSVNPSGTIPTITSGDYKVIGNFISFYMFLTSTQPSLKEKLCPDRVRIEVER